MMEMNMEEGDDENRSQSEPEVIPIDSDSDDNDAENDKQKESDDESRPIPLNINQSIFEVDDDEGVTVVDAFDVMQFEVTIEEEGQDSQRTRNADTPSSIASTSSSSISRRPRRAAAEAAAKTIHQISSQEQGEPPRVFRSRRPREDSDFNVEAYRHETQHSQSQSQPLSGKQKCHVCKKAAVCSIVVKQFGTDLYLCSNTCFNRFRNQGKDCKSKSLPCCKCGAMNEDTASRPTSVYFWETMNFCSDLCVGRYQMDVGCKCCTCGSSVPWASLGKYCVRFGSDIRQFCTPPCLEGYKKNARVCFNCQLDIRRIGNVILANIPSKSTPKEFCSNDCVEMYCDRNLHQPTRAKPQPEHNCTNCRSKRIVHKELALQSSNLKACSESCWQTVLTTRGIGRPEKCEMCSKFVSMDLGYNTPVLWLSSLSKVFGFCSHICKNLFILNSRRILSCTSCKVKKYNFDLIEYFTHSKSEYAVCSLACLPKGQDYLRKLRDVIYIPQPISDKTTPSILSRQQSSVSQTPIITSVTSAGPISNVRQRRRRKEQQLPPEPEGDEIQEIQILDEIEDVDIGDPETFLDSISVEFLDSLLEYMSKRPPDMRSISCSAKPRTKTVETQTDVSELDKMERIPLVSEEIVHYIPVPIPCLIGIPFPGYFLEKPVPYPFPLPYPVPFPIPVIIPSTEKKKTPDDNEDEDMEPEDRDKDKGPAVPANTEPKLSTHQEANNSTSANNSDKSANNESSTTTTETTTDDNTPSQESLSSTSLKSLTELTSEIGNRSPTKRLSTEDQKFNFGAKSPPANTEPPPRLPLLPSHKIEPAILSQNRVHHHHTHTPAAAQSTFQPTPAQNPFQPAPSLNPFQPLPPQNAYQPPHTFVPSPVFHPIPAINNSPTYIPPVMDFPAPVVSPQVVPSYSYNNSMGGGNYSGGTSCGMSSSSSSVAGCYSSPMSSPVVPVPGYNTHSPTASYMSTPPPPMHSMMSHHNPPVPKIFNRVEVALRAWKMMFGGSSDPRSVSSMELSYKLCDIVNRGSKPNGEKYRGDNLLIISLGIQQMLRDSSRVDKIFYDAVYYNFVLAFTDFVERELAVGYRASIEELHFWDTSELGASSPGVVLFTLMYMFQKYFGIKSWELHSSLHFSHIVIQSRYDQCGRMMRYLSVIGLPGAITNEIPEDVNCPTRCMIKVYEFYRMMSESPNGPLYKCIRQDCTPRTPWFTNQPLDKLMIYQMLLRASMIKSGSGVS